MLEYDLGLREELSGILEGRKGGVGKEKGGGESLL